MDLWTCWRAETGVTCIDLYIQWIPKGLECKKVFNPPVPDLVPNKFQTAFPRASPLLKVSGGLALENADRGSTTVLPASLSAPPNELQGFFLATPAGLREYLSHRWSKPRVRDKREASLKMIHQGVSQEQFTPVVTSVLLRLVWLVTRLTASTRSFLQV